MKLAIETSYGHDCLFVFRLLWRGDTDHLDMWNQHWEKGQIKKLLVALDGSMKTYDCRAGRIIFYFYHAVFIMMISLLII